MVDRPVIEIDRATWGFGERVNGPNNSRLLTKDGLRCCLGFAAAQLGVPDNVLLDKPTLDASTTILAHHHQKIVSLFEPDKYWMNEWSEEAMKLNDVTKETNHMCAVFNTTAEREAAIVALGERPDAPVRFKFVGEYPPGVEVK
jgi:hypothetical protein